MEPRAETNSGSKRISPFRAIFGLILVAVILAGITALILYLIYRPTNPKFSVLAANLYDLNISFARVTLRLQFTLNVHNPSQRSAIFFDRMQAQVLFGDEAVVPPLPLPPLHVREGGTETLVPLLGGGEAVPVSPATVNGLRAVWKVGAVSLPLVVLGRIKYKAGIFYSSWRDVFVRCEIVMALPGKEILHDTSALLGIPDCTIDI